MSDDRPFAERIADGDLAAFESPELPLELLLEPGAPWLQGGRCSLAADILRAVATDVSAASVPWTAITAVLDPWLGGAAAPDCPVRDELHAAATPAAKLSIMVALPFIANDSDDEDDTIRWATPACLELAAALWPFLPAGTVTDLDWSRRLRIAQRFCLHKNPFDPMPSDLKRRLWMGQLEALRDPELPLLLLAEPGAPWWWEAMLACCESIARAVQDREGVPRGLQTSIVTCASARGRVGAGLALAEARRRLTACPLPPTDLVEALRRLEMFYG